MPFGVLGTALLADTIGLVGVFAEELRVTGAGFGGLLVEGATFV